MTQSSQRLGQFAWCSYDWANSAFPTVIITFVFSAYFAKAVAADAITGTSQWSYAIAASMFVAALLSPALGAIADAGGRRKPWVLSFSLVAALATATLWHATPDAGSVLWILLAVGLANFAFETAGVFYNAMLPALVPPERIGRLSGWGWGLGYLGGLACLVVALVFLIRPSPPLFGLDAGMAEPVRASALLVAGWFLLFSLPFFVFTPDGRTRGLGPVAAVRGGLATLAHTLRHARRYRQVGLFLIAHMLYADGLNTLFSVGGIFAAVTFGMTFDELLLFGIALNVTAGLGAFGFGWIDDWIGPKRTIVIAVTAIAVLGAALLLVTSKTAFWALALPLGVFLGPAQSASRSLMARLAPKDMLAEMFGLYALAGKATAFIGPALFGFVTALAGSQRWGLATVLVFLVLGLSLLAPVRDPGARRADPAPAA